jgi:hypothetical protein
MVLNAFAFLGNPNLKKVGTKIDFTQEQESEYKKCMNDPVYFAMNYMKIVNVDEGLIPFNMWPFQQKMLRTFWDNRFVICKCPRQVGKTTSIIAYLLHQAIFNANQNIAILANKGSTARVILARIRLAYEYLPKWMQQGIVTWNKGDIELENGSKIKADSTASDAIRGDTYNIVFLDEFAFVKNNQADDFFNSVYPTISSGKTTKVLIVSTPNGLNHFYKKWMDATEKRSDYVPFEVHWSAVPGRDEAWKQQTIRNTSEEQFAQEFETEFLGSSDTLISGRKLRQLTWKNPSCDEDGWTVFTAAQPGHTYCMTVDPSRGQNKDSHAFSVIDVTNIPYRQVARYKNAAISPLLLPTIVHNAARMYNDAHVLIEISDNGQQIADILHYELEYENIIKLMTKGKMGQSISAGHQKRLQLGLKQSTATKRMGCSNLKALVENDKLLVEDFETIHELSTFTAQKESYMAEEGNHDDLAMSLVMFGWLVGQRFFKETINNDVRKDMQEEQLHVYDQDMVPWGAYDNGLGQDDEELDGLGDRWVREREALYPWDSYNIDWRTKL